MENQIVLSTYSIHTIQKDIKIIKSNKLGYPYSLIAVVCICGSFIHIKKPLILTVRSWRSKRGTVNMATPILLIHDYL